MEFLISIFERTKTEVNVMALCSAAGGLFSFMLGGVDAPVKALLILICLDYASGMVAAWKTGALSSNRGYKGVLRKVVIVLVVALANLLDTAMGMHTLRTMAVCGYAGMEGLSLIENMDRAGYGEYIPEFLRTKLQQLREEKGVKV